MSLFTKVTEHMKKQRAINSGEEYVPPEPKIPLDMSATNKMLEAIHDSATKVKEVVKPKGKITIDGKEYVGDNFCVKGKSIFIDNNEVIECDDSASMVIENIQGTVKNLLIAHPTNIKNVFGEVNLKTDSEVTVDGKVEGDLASHGNIKVNGNVTGDIDGEDITCNDVSGNVQADGKISCGNVDGNVSSSDSITCGDVSGDIEGSSEVKCGSVGGNVDCDENVTCGSVGGDVDAGEDVKCGDITGNVESDGNITCGDITGDVEAGEDVTAKSIHGDIEAGGNVRIGGS